MAMAVADCLMESMPMTAPKFIRNKPENTPVARPKPTANAVPAAPGAPAPRISSVPMAMPAGKTQRASTEPNTRSKLLWNRPHAASVAVVATMDSRYV